MFKLPENLLWWGRKEQNDLENQLFDKLQPDRGGLACIGDDGSKAAIYGIKLSSTIGKTEDGHTLSVRVKTKVRIRVMHLIVFLAIFACFTMGMLTVHYVQIQELRKENLVLRKTVEQIQEETLDKLAGLFEPPELGAGSVFQQQVQEDKSSISRYKRSSGGKFDIRTKPAVPPRDRDPVMSMQLYLNCHGITARNTKETGVPLGPWNYDKESVAEALVSVHGNKIVVKEEGIYYIYAQVRFDIMTIKSPNGNGTESLKFKNEVPRFDIFLEKRPIAKCVPGRYGENTCFTATTVKLRKGSNLFLNAVAPSSEMSVYSNDTGGKTYIGFVKLRDL